MMLTLALGIPARLRTEFTDLSNYRFGCACRIPACGSSSRPFCFGVDSVCEGERLELWLVDSSLFFRGIFMSVCYIHNY
jgi:hypothetical protein